MCNQHNSKSWNLFFLLICQVLFLFGTINKDNCKKIFRFIFGFFFSQLHKKGFRTIDGLDPAAGMLAVARKKNVYSRLVCEFMSEKRLPIENGKIMLVVSLMLNFAISQHWK